MNTVKTRRRARAAGKKRFLRLRREFYFLRTERLLSVCNLLLCRAC
ncbi:MAG: hypothetical protein M0025_12415 [Elusimicrobia bacterium]|nr:hypothetical protein [Elusimicrobiota bacterium]